MGYVYMEQSFHFGWENNHSMNCGALGNGFYKSRLLAAS